MPSPVFQATKEYNASVQERLVLDSETISQAAQRGKIADLPDGGLSYFRKEGRTGKQLFMNLGPAVWSSAPSCEAQE